MTQVDLLILAIYIICVAYVINQAIQSLDARFNVQVNQGEIKQQITDQALQEILEIKFKLEERYTKADQLQKLAVSIDNKSQQYSIYIDWDHSSLTDFEGRSRRVIRLMPGLTPDLFQPQAFSVIAPGKTLKEAVTAEDVLKRESDAGAVKVSGPIVDLSKLKKVSDTKAFVLRLVLRVFDPITSTGSDRVHVLTCLFTARRLPWTDALPWKHIKPG